MAKEGGIGCTRDSCSLPKVGSERGDNPYSLRTLILLTVARVE